MVYRVACRVGVISTATTDEIVALPFLVFEAVIVDIETDSIEMAIVTVVIFIFAKAVFTVEHFFVSVERDSLGPDDEHDANANPNFYGGLSRET